MGMYRGNTLHCSMTMPGTDHRHLKCKVAGSTRLNQHNTDVCAATTCRHAQTARWHKSNQHCYVAALHPTVTATITAREYY